MNGYTALNELAYEGITPIEAFHSQLKPESGLYDDDDDDDFFKKKTMKKIRISKLLSIKFTSSV